MRNHLQNDLFREDKNLWPIQVVWDERTVEQTASGGQGKISTPDFDKDLREARTVLQKVRDDYAASAADSSVEKIEKMERYVRELEGLKREYDKKKTPEVTSKLADLKKTLPQDFAAKLQSARAEEKKDSQERSTSSYEKGKSYNIETPRGGNINVRRNGSNFTDFSEFKNGTSVEVTNDALQVIHNQGLDKYRFILVKGTDAKGKKVEGLIATAYLKNAQGSFGEGRPTKGKGGGTKSRRSIEGGGTGIKAKLPKDEGVIEADKAKPPYAQMKWLQGELFEKGIVSKFWQGGEYFNLSLQTAGKKFKIFAKVGGDKVTLMEENEKVIVTTDAHTLLPIIKALPQERAKENLKGVAAERFLNVQKVISFDNREHGQVDLYVQYKDGDTTKYAKLWKKKDGDNVWGEQGKNDGKASLTKEEFENAQANEKNPGWKVETVKPGKKAEALESDPNDSMSRAMRWIREELLASGVQSQVSKETIQGTKTERYLMKVTHGGRHFVLSGTKGSTTVSLLETNDATFNAAKEGGMSAEISDSSRYEVLTDKIRDSAKETMLAELEYLRGELVKLGYKPLAFQNVGGDNDFIGFDFSVGPRNLMVRGKRGEEKVSLMEGATTLATSDNKNDLYKILDKVKEAGPRNIDRVLIETARLDKVKQAVQTIGGAYLGKYGDNEHIVVVKEDGGYALRGYKFVGDSVDLPSLTDSFKRSPEFQTFLRTNNLSPVVSGNATTVALPDGKVLSWEGSGEMTNLTVRDGSPEAQAKQALETQKTNLIKALEYSSGEMKKVLDVYRAKNPTAADLEKGKGTMYDRLLDAYGQYQTWLKDVPQNTDEEGTSKVETAYQGSLEYVDWFIRDLNISSPAAAQQPPVPKKTPTPKPTLDISKIQQEGVARNTALGAVKENKGAILSEAKNDIKNIKDAASIRKVLSVSYSTRDGTMIKVEYTTLSEQTENGTIRLEGSNPFGLKENETATSGPLVDALNEHLVQ